MRAVALVMPSTGLTPGEELQEAEAEEDRADVDPQGGDAVGDQLVMDPILEVEEPSQ